MALIEPFIVIASGLLATTYGYSEPNCGDIGKPQPCRAGAVTASGEPFNPAAATAAVAAPTRLRIQARWLKLRVDNGSCEWIFLTDKMNPRYIGERGFDLTPAAVELLTKQPATPTWSGVVHVCEAGDE
jgi:hypothetical protein